MDSRKGWNHTCEAWQLICLVPSEKSSLKTVQNFTAEFKVVLWAIGRDSCMCGNSLNQIHLFLGNASFPRCIQLIPAESVFKNAINIFPPSIQLYTKTLIINYLLSLSLSPISQFQSYITHSFAPGRCLVFPACTDPIKLRTFQVESHPPLTQIRARRQNYFFGFLGEMSMAGPGAGMSIGNMSTHNSSRPCNIGKTQLLVPDAPKFNFLPLDSIFRLHCFFVYFIYYKPLYIAIFYKHEISQVIHFELRTVGQFFEVHKLNSKGTSLLYCFPGPAISIQRYIVSEHRGSNK